VPINNVPINNEEIKKCRNEEINVLINNVTICQLRNEEIKNSD
jgi:hypothetical protein